VARICRHEGPPEKEPASAQPITFERQRPRSISEVDSGRRVLDNDFRSRTLLRLGFSSFIKFLLAPAG
jgi:hypothetical protein